MIVVPCVLQWLCSFDCFSNSNSYYCYFFFYKYPSNCWRTKCSWCPPTPHLHLHLHHPRCPWTARGPVEISAIVLVILLPSTFLTKIHHFFQSVLVHKYQFTCARARACVSVYVSGLSQPLVRRIMLPDYHLISISFPSHYRTSSRRVRARMRVLSWTFASDLQLLLFFYVLARTRPEEYIYPCDTPSVLSPSLSVSLSLPSSLSPFLPTCVIILKVTISLCLLLICLF